MNIIGYRRRRTQGNFENASALSTHRGRRRPAVQQFAAAAEPE
jgi:hypothetical protein